MILEQVISGGQTGADRAALIAAKRCGIRTGGWMPHGFLAFDGKHPEFAEIYGMKELMSSRYPPRTAMNVKHSDGTLRFATNWESPGEILTANLCRKYAKPYLDLEPCSGFSTEQAAVWLAENNIRILNVAGNAERTSPGIQELVCEYLIDLFQLLQLSAPAA